MKLPPALLAVIAVVVFATCVTCGFWQLSRLAAKRALNAERRAVLAAEPEPLAADAAGIAAQAGRKVVAFGEYDTTRHVLLSARFHDADLGVQLLTPLRLPGGPALLVDRGWTRAEDGQHAAPDAFAEPGPRRVVGYLARVPARPGMPPWRRLEGAAPELWSTHELDSASVLTHVPGVQANVLLVMLPGSAAPAGLAREGPPEWDENVHLSYAVQWFSFAIVTLVGSIALAIRSRRARAAAAPGARA